MIKTTVNMHVNFLRNKQTGSEKIEMIIFEVLDIRIKWQWPPRDGNLVEFQVFSMFITFKMFHVVVQRVIHQKKSE